MMQFTGQDGEYNMEPQMQEAPKQKIVAFLLAFFLGGLGIHNFYLGNTGKGVAQLILTITVFGAFISLPWAFIEAIMIIAGSPTDANGIPLE